MKKKVRDEDKMIKTLNEHKDVGTFVINTAKLENLDVEHTYGNSSSGDFEFKVNDKNKLISALDKHLIKNKVVEISKKKEDN